MTSSKEMNNGPEYILHEAIRKTRKDIVEALLTVDTEDYDSLNGTSTRSIGEVLWDIGHRLEALWGLK